MGEESSPSSHEHTSLHNGYCFLSTYYALGPVLVTLVPCNTATLPLYRSAN